MPAFEIYKPDTAVKSRWLFAGSTGSLLLFGAYQLFYTVPEGWRRHMIDAFRPLGEEFPLSWAFVLSVAFVVAGAYGLWRAANHPKLVDFFAETEVEMTKVAWSSRNEVIGSSVVVIATVVILGAWIALVDIVLSLNWGGWIGGTLGKLRGG